MAAPAVAGQVLAASPPGRDRAEGVASAVAVLQQREARGDAGGMRRVNVEVLANANAGASGGSAGRSSQGHRRLGDAPGRHRFQRRAS